MKIKEFFSAPAPVFSFEFFPPKTDEGERSLLKTIDALHELKPSFVSVTYGAGGSTRLKTVDLVSRIKNDIGLEVMAHLTCVGHTQFEIRSILDDFMKAGIDNVLALRGDPPFGQQQFIRLQNGFSHASELVRYIKAEYPFCVAVAGYPEKHTEALSLEDDLRNFKNKVQRGADFAISQLFFNNDDYFSFVEKVRDMGVSVPIIPGIMPVTDFEQLKRFTTMCGAKIPAHLAQRFEAVAADKEKVTQLGIDYATKQCEGLLRGGAPGIHFYTLNKSHSTVKIFRNLQASLRI
jgi:methylenetetrahydrofolate reductase (NADPH)